MINELEEAVVNRIKVKLTTAVSQINIQRGVESIPQPGVHFSIEEGKFRKVTSETYEQEVTGYVDIIFKHLQNEELRRKGIYLILEGIVQCLLLQKLGLKISPIIPKDFRNVTTPEQKSEGQIIFTLTFTTAWNIAKLDDEAIIDLLTVGFEYFLIPDDGKADTEDKLTRTVDESF